MTTFDRQLIYVGTYTHTGADEVGRSEGLFLFEFDASTAKLDFRGAVQDVVNPSFLVLSKHRPYLLAVNEGAQSPGNPEGGVSAFAVDRESGQLSFLNKQPSRGVSPCYITLDASEKWAVVTNYDSGSIAVFRVGRDGRLGETSHVTQNRGRSLMPVRQESPHPHCAIFDPSQQYVLVADLGLDQILLFQFDASQGRLLPHDPPAVAAAPGSGPRHLEFHPNGRYLYVTNELNSSISAYVWNQDRGALTHLQTISSLPDGFVGANILADLHVTQDGCFLYASNRGHDSIAVFAIEAPTGVLTRLETGSCGGRTPRNFALDLTEHYLLVANQNSDNLVVFRRDANDGRLIPVGASTSVPSPVCVRVSVSNHQ